MDSKAKQWIADVFHCENSWGEVQTDDDMFIMLTETMKEKDPDDYSPSPSLAHECAAYWNELCAIYAN